MSTEERKYEMPQWIRDEIDSYVDHRGLPGGFITSCLKDDLLHAVVLSDPGSLLAIRDIMRYLRYEVPVRCWGNARKIQEYLKEGEERRANVMTFEKGDRVLYKPSPSSSLEKGEEGLFKRYNEAGGSFVVFLKSFTEATPENIDNWTAASCDTKCLSLIERRR